MCGLSAIITNCLYKELQYNIIMSNRKQAIKILNEEVESITGLSLADLPDTALLADFIDELECMFEEEEELVDIKEVAAEFAREFLKEEGLEMDEDAEEDEEY